MKKVEVHWFSPDGSHGVVNHFPGDNTELSGGDHDGHRKALLNKAMKVAYDWSKVFPNDRFRVVEV